MTESASRGVRRRLDVLAVLCALLLSALAPSVAAAADPAAEPPAGHPATERVIVTFKARPSANATRAIQAAGGRIRLRFNHVDGLAVELPAKAVEALRRNPLVASVEPDAQLFALDHAGNTGDLEYENAWGVEHIGTKPVHDAGIRGQGVRVAIIDTGIDYIHDDPDNTPYVVDPEFNSNYRGGYDFFNDDADPMDDNGHGTHVAGILAAEKNGYLVVGVAPQVDLYALKVLGADGSGEYSGLIAALDWAIAHDMDVVNMSLGGHEPSAALQAEIEAAWAAGITLVAASGNVVTIQDLIYGCPVAYPAAYDEVIAVSFTGSDNKLTGYSCTGPQVDLAAPGNQIFAPVPVGSCMFCSPYGYRAESGTSMASPHVAGVAALVLSKGIANAGDPNTLADDVKAHLCATTTPAAGMAPTDPRYAKWYGCGIVDAERALLEVPPPPPVGVNHPPLANDDAATTAEEAPVDVAVLANDSDPDADPLVVSGVTEPAFGATSVNADGTVRYAPSPNANGTDTFSYSLSDGAGGTDTATVIVTVTAVNDPPVAGDDSLVTTRDTGSTLAVLANDTDVDGDSLSVAAVTDPPNGTATVEASGAITYAPDPGFDGPDGFDYTAADGAGGSDVGHVDVTVTADNHPPAAIDDVLSTDEDTPAALDPAANDSDEDGGALVVTGVGQPIHGTAALQAGGTVAYTPDPNYFGPDAFGYTVADGAGATAQANVSVSIGPVNDPPVGVADAVATAEDSPVNVAVTANDTDIDGDSLFAVDIADPGLGLEVVEPDGTVTYTPPLDYAGTDSFSYIVSDGSGGTATASVSVTITPANDAPTAASRSLSVLYGTPLTMQLSGADVETCELTFALLTPPAHGTLGSVSKITCAFILAPYTDYSKIKYTPAAGYSGPDSFTYRTFDGSLWSEPATVSLTVEEPALFHVGDLDGTRTKQTSTWTAKVTILVHNEVERPVQSVAVKAVWSTGSATISCTTTASGLCSMSKSAIPLTTPSVTFTITGLSDPSGIYDSASNHDPDASSNGTVIVVVRP